jgi:hypothetical protein
LLSVLLPRDFLGHTLGLKGPQQEAFGAKKKRYRPGLIEEQDEYCFSSDQRGDFE